MRGVYGFMVDDDVLYDLIGFVDTLSYYARDEYDKERFSLLSNILLELTHHKNDTVLLDDSFDDFRFQF